jgi:hypothetical protein
MSDHDKRADETLRDPAAKAKSRKNDPEAPDTSQSAKKPYTPPQLIPWGTLRDVTRAVGPHGASDGGTKSQKRATR